MGLFQPTAILQNENKRGEMKAPKGTRYFALPVPTNLDTFVYMLCTFIRNNLFIS
jgi:hypothetical protein